MGRVAHLTTVDASLRFLVLAQLEAVRDAGGDAVGISAPGSWTHELESRGIRHVALPSSTRGADVRADLRAAVELWRVLRRERPDVLHTHNPKPGVYGRVVGRLAGVPIVVNTVHGLYATPEDRLAKRLAVYAVEAVASRFSDAELVQSAEDHRLMTRWRIAPARRTRVLGNGVDLERFDPTRHAATRRRERAALGVGDGDVVVGTVGRLVAEKGYLELFDAARRLGGRAAVVVAGPDDPDKRDRLDRAAVEAARAAGVRFLGMREDVESVYAALDVFALPSYREGYPRSVMEAAAMALPVVATDIRGCREVVDHGRTGLLVPARDARALAAALGELVDDAARRHAMGRAARALAEERFDERRVVARVLDAYAAAARRKGRPPVVAPSAFTGTGA